MPKLKIILFSVILVLTSITLIRQALAQDAILPFGEPFTSDIAEDDTNRYRFEGHRNDVIEVAIRVTEGNLRPEVSLYDPTNTLQAQLKGTSTTETTFVFRLSSAGDYHLEIRSLDATSGSYEVTVNLLEAGLREFEQGNLALGQTARQELSDTVPYHMWNFSGRSGQVVDIRMIATEGDLEPVISLLSPGGDVIATSSAELNGEDQQEAHLLAFRLPGDGVYRISARRAGETLGFGGNTSGSYDLTIALRNGPTATRIPLRGGDSLPGRLTSDSPLALFEVVAAGIYILDIELSNPHCLVEVALTNEGVTLLDQFSGRSPLRHAFAVPAIQTPVLEISSSQCPTPERLDFNLNLMSANTDLPLQPLPNGVSLAGSGQNTLDRWFFQAQAGDLVRIQAQKSALRTESFIRLVNAEAVTLYREAFYTHFDQTIYLEAGGLYFIQVATNGVPYTLEQSLVGQQGRLLSDETATWETFLDLTSPQTQQLQLQGNLGANAILAVQAPSGEILASTRATSLSLPFLENLFFPQAGRYTVKVFAERPPTRLENKRVDGGNLALGSSAKGTLTAPIPTNLWYFNLTADQEFDVTLDVLTPNSPLPQVSLLAQTGERIQPAFEVRETATYRLLRLRPPQDGRYTILISSNNDQAFLDYRLTLIPSTPLAPNETLTARPPSNEGFTSTATTSNPLLIPSFETLPDTLFTTARSLSLPTGVRVEVAENQRYHVWKINLSRGQRIAVQATNTSPGSAPGLSLLDENRQVLAENWQINRTDTDLYYRARSGGTYYLALTATPNGGRYWVTAQTQSEIDESVPAIIDGIPLEFGRIYQASFNRAREEATYIFWGQRSSTLYLTSRAEFGELVPNLRLVSLNTERTIAEVEYDSTLEQASLPSVRLPDSGLYAVIVTATPRQREETYSRYRLQISLISGQDAPKGVLNTEAIGALGVVGTSTPWFIHAQAGEKISLTAEPLSATGPSPLTLVVADSAGTPFFRKDALLTVNQITIHNLILPKTGIYQIILRGGNDSSGNYRFHLTRQLPYDPALPYAIGYGNPVSNVLSQTNRLDRWMLGGNMGDTITIAAQWLSGEATPLGFQLETPSGQVLRIGADRNNGGARESNIILPETGIYYISLGSASELEGASAYQLSVQLQNHLHPNSSGTRIGYNLPHTGTLFADDPHDYWLFDGIAGQTVQIEVQGDGILRPAFALIPAESPLEAGQLTPLLSRTGTATTPAILTDFVLPQSGAYALRIGGIDNTTGFYTVSVRHNPAAISPSQLLENNLAYTQNLRQGEVQTWVFKGQAGDSIRATISIPRRSSLIPSLTILAPTGERLLTETRFDGKIMTLTNYVLPLTGDYRLEITGTLSDGNAPSGDYTLTFNQTLGAPPPEALSLSYGNAGINTLSETNPSDLWAFEGQAGDQIRLRGFRTSGDLDLYLRVSSPDGTLLSTDDDSLGNLDAEITARLPLDGTYLVTIGTVRDHIAAPENNYRLELTLDYRPASQPLDSSRFITYGTHLTDSFAPITANSPEILTWYFDGQAGDQVNIVIQFPPNDSPLRLFLADGAGTQYIQGERQEDRAVIRDFTLPTTGVYQIIIQRSLDTLITQHYPYTLRLGLSADQFTSNFTSRFIAKGGTQGGNLSSTSPTHTWLYNGTAGETIRLSLLRLQGQTTPSILLYSPTNTVLWQQAASNNDTSVSATLTLPTSGIYQVAVLASGEAPTDYRLTLNSDLTATLAGQLTLQETEYGNLDAATNRAVWVITAPITAPLYIRAEVVSGNLRLQLHLEDDKGVILTQGQYDPLTNTIALIHTSPLAMGEYRLIVSAEGGTASGMAGVYRLRLGDTPLDPALLGATTLPDNTLITGTLDGSQSSLYGFWGAINTPISLYINPITGSEQPYLEVFDGQNNLLASSRGTLYDLYVPANGFYVVRVSHPSPLGYEIGQFPRALSAQTPAQPARRQVNLSGNLSQGTPIKLWSIEATSGDVLTFSVSDFSPGVRHEMVLFDPDGFPIGTALEGEDAEVILPSVFMAKTGVYILRVGAWLGQVSPNGTQHILRIDTVDERLGSSGGSIHVFGQEVRGGLTPQDPADSWMFQGTAGSTLTILARNRQGNDPLTLSLSNHLGEILHLEGYVTSEENKISITGLPLLTSGRYTITVALESAEANPLTIYSLQVDLGNLDHDSILSQARTLVVGESITGTLASQSSQGWVFFGKAGQSLSIHLASTGNLGTILLDPHGTALSWNNPSLLLEDGFYSLIVTNASPQQHDYSLQIAEQVLSATWQWHLKVGQTERVVLSPGAPLHEWHLSGYNTGDYSIIIRPTSLNWQPRAYILDDLGNTISTTLANTIGSLAISAHLESNQMYRLFVTASDSELGAYDILFQTADNQTSPTYITLETTETGALSPLDTTDEWLWESGNNALLNLHMTRRSGTATLSVRLYAPGYLLVGEYNPDENGTLEVLNIPLPVAGVYIIQVNRAEALTSSSEATYELRLSSPTQ